MNEKTPKNRTQVQSDVAPVGSEASRESVSNGENSTRRGRIIARLAIFFERASMGGSRISDRVTEKAPDRSDYFVSGPGDATFNVSSEVAEKIAAKNGGELPDHIRIREDQLIN